MACPRLVNVRSDVGCGIVFTTFNETRDGGESQGHGDNAQRNPDRNLTAKAEPGLVQSVVVHRVANELEGDKAQNHGQSQRQVHQTFQQASDKEIQLAQTHESKDVSGKDEIPLAGETIGRRNRVEGEKQVRGAQGDTNHEHRGCESFTVLANEKIVPR